MEERFPPRLAGEEVLISHFDINETPFLIISPTDARPVALRLTCFRLTIAPHERRLPILSIPLTSVESLERTRERVKHQRLSGETDAVVIQTKSVLAIRLAWRRSSELCVLLTRSVPLNLRSTFAFAYAAALAKKASIVPLLHASAPAAEADADGPRLLCASSGFSECIPAVKVTLGPQHYPYWPLAVSLIDAAKGEAAVNAESGDGSGSERSAAVSVPDGWSLFCPHREFHRQAAAAAVVSAKSSAKSTSTSALAGAAPGGAVAVEGSPASPKSRKPKALQLQADTLDTDAGVPCHSAYRLSLFNVDMKCPSYGPYVCVPTGADDHLLESASLYRSRGRIPIVSYFTASGACIARSSQPLPGMTGKKSESDERYASLLAAGTQPDRPGVVMAPGVASPASPHGAAIQDSVDSPTCRSPTASSPTSMPVSFESFAPPSLVGGAPPSLMAGSPPPLVGSSPPLLPQTSATTVTPAAPASVASQKRKTARRLYIVDARGLMVARANRSKGGGFESGYANAALLFLEMPNIHGVTEALGKLRAAAVHYNNDMSSATRNTAYNLLKPERDTNGEIDSSTPIEATHCAAGGAIPGNGKSGNHMFHNAVDSSAWMLMIQRMLWSTVKLTDLLLDGSSVLTHCTDGWDRTSQLVTNVELCMDPYFRTCEGFATLIEKDWIYVGHKFAERCSHMLRTTADFPANPTTRSDASGVDKIQNIYNTGSSSQVSPIFLQWLDGIYQIMLQYPNSFEFTPAFLLVIADALYSCQYGTFLCNNDAERHMARVPGSTVSLWTDLFAMIAVEREYIVSVDDWQLPTAPLLNPTYTPPSCGGPVHLRPSCNSKNMVPWQSFLFKYESEISSFRSHQDELYSLPMLGGTVSWSEVRPYIMPPGLLSLIAKKFRPQSIDCAPFVVTTRCCATVHQGATTSADRINRSETNDASEESPGATAAQVSPDEVNLRYGFILAQSTMPVRHLPAPEEAEVATSGTPKILESISALWTDKASECSNPRCRTTFGLLTRRHTCRSCRKPFCANCASRKVVIQDWGMEPHRVCNMCDAMLQRQ